MEGTFNQGTRCCDLHHARYLGMEKRQLQQVITAVVLNLVRVLDWLAKVPRAATHASAFARMIAATA